MRRLVLTVSSLTLLAACGKNGKGGDSAKNAPNLEQALARVDDHVITVADLERQIAKQPPFVRARYSSIERRKELLDNLVRTEVMAKEAENHGYDKDPDVLRVVKMQMVQQFVQREFDAKMKVEDVPEADVQKYYDAHPNEFTQQEEVRVSQIFTKDKAKAAKALAAVKALPKTDDKGFRDLVTKLSEDEDSKSRGGDLTFMDRKNTAYPKPVIEAAFALKEVNELSPVIGSDKGFHILKLTQRRPGFTRPMSEVKRQIQTRLYYEQRTKRMEAWVQEMKSKLKIEVYEDKLKQVKIDTTAPATATAGVPPQGAVPNPMMRPMGLQPPGLAPPKVHP
jgi:peptidyl-prolyl cis-trans isomerase C